MLLELDPPLPALAPHRRLGAGSGGRFRFEPLGMGGTENREPGVAGMASIAGRRGVFGLGRGETVVPLGVVPDASFTDEL